MPRPAAKPGRKGKEMIVKRYAQISEETARRAKQAYSLFDYIERSKPSPHYLLYIMEETNMEKIINIHEFSKRFNREYEFLYDCEDENNVPGYDEAVAEFDEFIKIHGDFVGEFAKFRGDFISSDREAAAFMFALASME